MKLQGPGIAILVLSWVITLYTLWQMVEMHEMVPGKRFDRYHELGQHVFGDKLGSLDCCATATNCTSWSKYCLHGYWRKSLKKFHDVVCPNCKDIRLTYFIMIFASVQMVLAHLPNLNSISVISLAAAVMSLGYSTIAWASTLNKGVQPDVDYSYKARTRTGAFFDFITALGDVAFAYAGHNVVWRFKQQSPLLQRSPPRNPCGEELSLHISSSPLLLPSCLDWILDICNCSVRLAGNCIGEETPFFSFFHASLCYSHGICWAHNVCWYMHSILQWPAFFLRRICFCPNNILSPLHHVAFHLQTEEVQLLLDSKLGLRYTWRSLDDTVTHWCPKAYHPYSQGLRILLMNILPKAITGAGQIRREGINNYFAGCALGRKLEFNNSGIYVRVSLHNHQHDMQIHHCLGLVEVIFCYAKQHFVA
ncbi:hypothetical protein NC652_022369 [Populus alba x Populus x berolinensis]|nr:hypothetical protein NC652_022369 [Populus alba x Populus x berolinensis]